MSDEEVVRLRAIGTSFRQIARELGVSLAGVQRALKRAAD
jgi:DNA-directed RNA polymerase specialized sigma24 family protein